MTTEINQFYWEKRYSDKDTGWDLGAVSTPLKTYFDQLADTTLRILIPGCGNGYEAEYLWKKGFKNVFVVEYAKEPLENFKKRVPGFPADQLVMLDFFLLEGKFDLIVEQTFFCALDPSFRVSYCKKMASLLSENGKLVGVLFNDPLNSDKPPFGGNEIEYRLLMEPYLKISQMEVCYNSIPPRANRELFFSATSK